MAQAKLITAVNTLSADTSPLLSRLKENLQPYYNSEKSDELAQLSVQELQKLWLTPTTATTKRTEQMDAALKNYYLKAADLQLTDICHIYLDTLNQLNKPLVPLVQLVRLQHDYGIQDSEFSQELNTELDRFSKENKNLMHPLVSASCKFSQTNNPWEEKLYILSEIEERQYQYLLHGIQLLNHGRGCSKDELARLNSDSCQTEITKILSITAEKRLIDVSSSARYLKDSIARQCLLLKTGKFGKKQSVFYVNIYGDRDRFAKEMRPFDALVALLDLYFSTQQLIIALTPMNQSCSAVLNMPDYLAEVCSKIEPKWQKKLMKVSSFGDKAKDFVAQHIPSETKSLDNVCSAALTK